MGIPLLQEEIFDFPPVNQATKEGIVAIGGDLSPERLIIAYSQGIFPWYSKGEPIMWWSLDPRMVIKPNEMKITKSLWKTIESNKYSCSIDADFEKVINMCAKAKREGQEGTWITEDMISAYCELHDLGFAHSVETYLDNELVGGLYGVSVGKIFCGESMFHTKTDASKVAFYHLTQFLMNHNFDLIDAQQETGHLHRLGAYTIPRKDFIKRVKASTKFPSLVGNWGDGSAKFKDVLIDNK